MSRSLTEQKVLKKLKIEDFRHLTKDKVITMATMLDKMDPEVAKKAIEQFPEFSETMKTILVEYKKSLDKGLEDNKESVKSFYETCDAIISSCQNMLEKEDLTFIEKKEILDQMVFVAKMKGEKNSEDKNFIAVMSAMGLFAVGITAATLVATLGGNLKIDTDDIKKLT